MSARLLEVVFSVGFLKWIWDGVLFLWRRFKKRVNAELYIAYRNPGPSGMAEKFTFLAIRNDTDKDIVVDMLMWESSWWHRWICGRNMPRTVVDKPIVKVAAGKGMQQAFVYMPNNLISPYTRYFGVRLTSRKIIWVSRRQMRRVLKEFKQDFPDWRTHKRELSPWKLKEYGEHAAGV